MLEICREQLGNMLASHLCNTQLRPTFCCPSVEMERRDRREGHGVAAIGLEQLRDARSSDDVLEADMVCLFDERRLDINRDIKHDINHSSFNSTPVPATGRWPVRHGLYLAHPPWILFCSFTTNSKMMR
jgi:hypothetical protein